MKSDAVKSGLAQAPHRSLFNALGMTKEEMERPLVGIVSSFNEIVPGHMNIDKIVDALQLKFDNLPEIVTKHKNSTKISYYCYSYTKCPNCGSVPPSEIEGLIPCDMQQSFFTLTTELLK